MRVLQFGKSGQLALALAVAGKDRADYQVLGSADVDFRDPGAPAQAVRDYRPEIVLIAAAYTDVDGAEGDRAAAFAVNAAAPEAIAHALKECGGALIHVSTDYVFDGRKAGRYLETDTTNPINVYGESKLAGEMAVLRAAPQSVVIRTSWVYSENGRNFVKTMLRAGAERDELHIVDDQIGRPTSANELAVTIWAVADAIASGRAHWGVHHFSGGGAAASWADFADAVFDIQRSKTGKRPRIVRIGSEDYLRPAQRPRNSMLDCGLIKEMYGIKLKPWRDALAQTMDRIEALGGSAE